MRRASTGNQLRLLFVGRLIDLKGVHLALQALAQLPPDVSAATLTVVGDGPERARLEVLAHRLGIAHRVRFAGQLPRDRVLACYQDHDVLLFPTLRDSGGFVVMEAMASGLPVICLALGGPAMAVSDETGIRVRALDPSQVVDDLAVAIARLARDPELRHRMGEAARMRAEREYSWDRKGELLRELYSGVGK
ncbi:MAG: hypothetical protein C4346_17615 [Chloroflexota bacterium]